MKKNKIIYRHEISDKEFHKLLDEADKIGYPAKFSEENANGGEK